MNFNPKNTLSYFNAVPQVKLFNLKDVHAAQFAINCKALYDIGGGDDGQANPDREAVEFYALNHLAAVVRKNFTQHEELPPVELSVMNAYQEVLRKQGVRMLNYMMLICTRESRHAQKGAAFEKAFTELFGTNVKKFAKSINGKGSTAAAEMFMSNPPDSGLGNYCDSMPYTFYKASFGGGYGGKPWGMIADTLASFINGLTSLEMMLDTAYTLAHNNGPMFNKGMMYSMYSKTLLKILDVQRSGQLPEMVMYDNTIAALGVGVRTLCQCMAAEYPKEFGEEVDWYKVEALGSLHKYPKEKQAMKVQPPPEPPKPVIKDGVKILGQFKVMPGQVADIYERNTATA